MEDRTLIRIEQYLEKIAGLKEEIVRLRESIERGLARNAFETSLLNDSSCDWITEDYLEFIRGEK